MYERLKRLYLAGMLNESGLENAVRLNAITEEQKNEIMDSKKDDSE